MRRGRLGTYSFGREVGKELVPRVFSSIVTAQDLQPQSSLVLHKLLEAYQRSKYIRLCRQQIHPRLPRVIINESHRIVLTTHARRLNWSTYISVYQRQAVLCAYVV